MITLVCQSFGVFRSYCATRHIIVIQRTSFLFSVFNFSGRISSSPSAFPDFNPRIAAAISIKMKTPFLPKINCIICINGSCSYRIHPIFKVFCTSRQDFLFIHTYVPSRILFEAFLLLKSVQLKLFRGRNLTFSPTLYFSTTTEKLSHMPSNC